jgi:hypothetical protein
VAGVLLPRVPTHPLACGAVESKLERHVNAGIAWRPEGRNSATTRSTSCIRCWGSVRMATFDTRLADLATDLHLG